jgi:ATPase family AAA domain-containing protein 1
MATGLYIARNFVSTLSQTLADPDREKQEQARLQAKAHLERLRKGAERKTERCAAGEPTDDSSVSRKGPRADELVLNEFENLIALEMVAPEDIPVGFDGKVARGNFESST